MTNGGQFECKCLQRPKSNSSAHPNDLILPSQWWFDYVFGDFLRYFEFPIGFGCFKFGNEAAHQGTLVCEPCLHIRLSSTYHTCTRMYAHTYIHIRSLYVHVCMCIFVYTYIYTYIHGRCIHVIELSVFDMYPLSDKKICFEVRWDGVLRWSRALEVLGRQPRTRIGRNTSQFGPPAWAPNSLAANIYV